MLARGIPWQSSGLDLVLSLQWVWVQSLAGELRSHKLCALWPKMRERKRCWPGLQSYESLTRAGQFASKVAYTHKRHVDAGCRLEVSDPHHVGLPVWFLESPHGLVASFPQSKWSRKARQKSQGLLCLGLEAALSCLSVLTVTHVSPVLCGRGLSKGVTVRRPSWDRGLSQWLVYL